MLAVCFALPAMAGSIVTQGKCVSYDEAKKVVVIEEFNTKFSKEHKYGEPTGKQCALDLSEALVGGGILRPATSSESPTMKKATRRWLPKS